MHNMGGYDDHFILRSFQRKYTHYTTKDGKAAYADVQVIPLNSEKNLQIRIGNIVFVDSYQFLAASLDTLVSTLRSSSKERFVLTSKHTGRKEFLFQKGVFPYEWFDSISKFEEKFLPPKKAFYSRLTEQHISDDDYKRAVNVWKHFKMKVRTVRMPMRQLLHLIHRVCY